MKTCAASTSSLPSSYFARNAVFGLLFQKPKGLQRQASDSGLLRKTPQQAELFKSHPTLPKLQELFPSPFQQVASERLLQYAEKKKQRDARISKEQEEQIAREQIEQTTLKETERLIAEKRARREAANVAMAPKGKMPKPFSGQYKSWDGAGYGLQQPRQMPPPSQMRFPPRSPDNSTSENSPPRAAQATAADAQSNARKETLFGAHSYSMGEKRGAAQRLVEERSKDPFRRAGQLLLELETKLEETRSLRAEDKQKAFRDMQRRFHPDKNPECSEAAKLVFQRLMEHRRYYLA